MNFTPDELVALSNAMQILRDSDKTGATPLQTHLIIDAYSALRALERSL